MCEEIKVIDDLGIRLMTLNRRYANCEKEDVPFEGMALMECEFSEAFEMLLEKAEEDEKQRLHMEFQSIAGMALAILLEDIEYILDAYEGVKNCFDMKEVTFEFYLEDNDTIISAIDGKVIDVILDDAHAKESTREAIELQMELAANRSESNCQMLLGEIKEIMGR